MGLKHKVGATSGTFFCLTGSAFRALAEQTGEFELLLGMARGEGNGEQEGRKRGESVGDITAN